MFETKHIVGNIIIDESVNYKNILQEHCQRRHLPLPVYDAVNELDTLFGCRVSACLSAGSEPVSASSSGYGNKKQAGQRAAQCE
jgi:dsRNA-specific ribonuclease